MKRTRIMIILALVLALLLSACSGTPANETEEEAAAVPPASETNPQEVNSPVDGGMVLVAESLELPEGMAYASAQCLDGDTIWLGGMSQDGAALGSVNLDGETFLVDMPKGCEYVYAACKVDKGIAVLAGTFPSWYMSADGTDVVYRLPDGRR